MQKITMTETVTIEDVNGDETTQTLNTVEYTLNMEEMTVEEFSGNNGWIWKTVESYNNDYTMGEWDFDEVITFKKFNDNKTYELKFEVEGSAYGFVSFGFKEESEEN